MKNWWAEIWLFFKLGPRSWRARERSFRKDKDRAMHDDRTGELGNRGPQFKTSYRQGVKSSLEPEKLEKWLKK